MYIDNVGYMMLDFYDNGKHIFIREHKLNALINNSLKDVFNNHVHHKNHCKLDNNPENLELISPKEHASLHSSGENHPMYNKHHSLESIEKMRKSKTNPCLIIKRYKDTSCNQRFVWSTHPQTNDKNKQITLCSVNLGKCVEKVQDFINSERNTLGYTHYKVRVNPHFKP